MPDDKQRSGYSFYCALTSNNIKDDPAAISPLYSNPNGKDIASARRVKYYGGTNDSNY